MGLPPQLKLLAVFNCRMHMHTHTKHINTHTEYTHSMSMSCSFTHRQTMHNYIASSPHCAWCLRTETQTVSIYRRTSQHKQVAGTYMHCARCMVKALNMIRSTITRRAIPEDDSTPFQCVRSFPTLQTVCKP